MSTTIDVGQLREWLAEGRAVTVLDVRREDERREWYVPGSRHVDLYDRLGREGPDAVAGLDLPGDRPVVTVCGAGRTSLTAADGLAERGFEAYSLSGGMKAWGHAWNTATLFLANGVEVVQVRRTGKGCLSYLVVHDGEALVIDAALDPEVFTDLASRRGATIRGVLDTHVHADHLSRSRALADTVDAPLYLPAQERVQYPFTPLAGGDHVPFGGTSLQVLHTPGHTWESSSYLLPDQALFTGDTLFVDSVGRPDLEAGPGEAAKRAKSLHASLTRLANLPGHVQVLPGHASAPLGFDGTVWGASLAEVRAGSEFLGLDEDSFVQRATAHVPPAPENHTRIVAFNESGERPDDTLEPDEVLELEAGANRCAI